MNCVGCSTEQHLPTPPFLKQVKLLQIRLYQLPAGCNHDRLRLQWFSTEIAPAPVAVDQFRQVASGCHAYPRGIPLGLELPGVPSPAEVTTEKVRTNLLRLVRPMGGTKNSLVSCGVKAFFDQSLPIWVCKDPVCSLRAANRPRSSLTPHHFHP